MPRLTPRRLGLRLGLPLCMTLALGVLVACNEPQAGPMVVGSEQGSALTRPVGTELTEGVQVLWLEGDEPGTLKKVELVGGEEGVQLIGAEVLPPPRKAGAIQFLVGWPPQQTQEIDLSTAVPAEGARIGTESESEEGWELLLGLRVVKDGFWHRRFIRVTYQVGDDEYRVDLPTTLTLCTTEKYEVDGHCPFQ